MTHDQRLRFKTSYDVQEGMLTYMKLKMNLVLICFLFLCSCSNVAYIYESQKYPRDTAIILNGNYYQINMFKCAEIRSVSEDGVLECYSATGDVSATQPPISDFDKNIIESYLNVKFGSEEHNKYLFNYYYKGGKEENQRKASVAMNNLKSANNTIDMLKESEKIEHQAFKKSVSNIGVYFKGSSDIQEHRQDMIRWHLRNAVYFFDKGFNE